MATPERVETVEEKPHACPDCDMKFATAQALGAHRAKAHGYRSARTKRREDPMQEVIRSWDKSQNGFSDELDRFLPKLAAEVQRRKTVGDDCIALADAYFALYTAPR